MDSRYPGRWFAFIFISFVCEVNCSSPPEYHVWPLTNTTLNYEVLGNEERGYLFGEQYVDGPFSSQKSAGAFQLTGTTHADLQMSTQFQSVFTLVVYFYLDYREGELLRYIDTDWNTVFRVWADNSYLYAEVYTSSRLTPDFISADTPLPINTWISIGLARDSDNGKLALGINDNVESEDKYNGNSFENDITLSRNGFLRLGSASGGIRGRVSCVVTSDRFDVKGTTEAAIERCTDTTYWTYTGPYGCMVSQCYNGAICTDDQTKLATCHCVKGYTGPFCQEEINECESMPCSNNQPCRDLLDGFQCECGPDYIGQLCETELSKQWDEGYYRLEKTGYGPNRTFSVTSTTTSNGRRCGQHCVQYPGCLSFTVTKLENNHFHCVLYTQVYAADWVLPDMRYYVPKYFTKS